MSVLLKTNFCGTNFPEFCKFLIDLRKSIPQKFPFHESFAKADTCEELFLNSFAKINKRLVI